MLASYLTNLWWRWNNKRVTVIGSLAGLVIGTVCIALLVSYLRHELSTDGFHQHANKIYLTIADLGPSGNFSALHIKRFYFFDPANYPGVEKATTVLRYGKGRMVLKAGSNTFTGVGLVVDSNFLEVFDFPMILGEPKALHDPGAMLVTRDFALQKFGTTDVLNKTVDWIGQRSNTYHIAGVLASIPTNSSIQFDFLIPHHSMRFNGIGGCFLLVNEHFDAAKFEVEITRRGREYYEGSESKVAPLEGLYFNRESWDLRGVTSKTGNVKTLYIIAVIAILVLVITILNIANLWALEVINDRKEILIRKVNGARRMDLTRFQIRKITPLIVFAVGLSCILYAYCLPAFKNLIGTEISIHWPEMLATILVVILFITALSLIYPLLLINQPVLEDSISRQLVNTKSATPRKVIIALQYTLTIILLISAIVVTRQLQMMLQKDLGFDYKDVVRTKLIYEQPYEFLSPEERRSVWEKMTNGHQFITAELRSCPYVEEFTQGWSPIEAFPFNFKPADAKGDHQAYKTLIITPGYEKVFGFRLETGRFFREDEARSRNKVLINEAARKLWNIEDISKSRINQQGISEGSLEIIGVVKDYNYEHLSRVPQPLFIKTQVTFEDDFFIKLRTGQRAEGLHFIRELFEKMNPNQTFEYTFMEEEIRELYRHEQRLAKVYVVLTIIAFLLSSIGLFVVALYEVQKRTKEVGIRKVNGAKISQIVSMLNRDFIKWVLLGFLFACPVAYFFLSKWLENFAYKTALSWWIFAMAGILAFCLALLTVSWQSWRAATRNPVEVLKYE